MEVFPKVEVPQVLLVVITTVGQNRRLYNRHGECLNDLLISSGHAVAYDGGTKAGFVKKIANRV